MVSIPWLDPLDQTQGFPPAEHALTEPDGLLAAGGDLNPQRLLNAYKNGIFPWYEAGHPILWWSPNPRAVLFIHEFKFHRSLRKKVRHAGMRVTFDQAFPDVMAECARTPRRGQHGTWISPEMLQAYTLLHHMGHAHSVEVRDDSNNLIGGLYGIALGRVFFGESMFSHCNDASKIGFATLLCHLQDWGFRLVDCQQATHHLTFLGAREIPRADFLQLIDRDIRMPGKPGPWHCDESLPVADWKPQIPPKT